jgi:hypothetical protein
MNREQAQRLNPIIGASLADTLANAAQAIDAASLFGEGDDMPPGAGVAWGRYAFLQGIRAALEYEAAHSARSE